MSGSMRWMAAAALTVIGITSVGCMHARHERPGLEARYHDYVDPCWPQRYSAQARGEVLAPFAVQANNGEIIAQTIWNYHFEGGTDKLTPAGIEALEVMVKKRPTPDTQIYVQTARDIAYDQAKAEETMKNRSELDAKRIAAVQKFLSVQPSTKGSTISVIAIDPSDPAFYARYPSNAINQLPSQYRATLGGGSAGGGAGGGGAAIGGR